MAHCDRFVFLDDVQLPRGRSYVYRCQLRKGEDTGWLSIPLKRESGQSIVSTKTADEEPWPRRHLARLRHEYAKTPHFTEVFSILEPLYVNSGGSLAEFNIRLIAELSNYLGLEVEFFRSSELKPDGMSDDRLIDLTRKLDGTVYVSGKGGQNYQNPAKFKACGIQLEVRVYTPIPYFPEDNFKAGLSILDPLFYLGRQTKELLAYP